MLVEPVKPPDPADPDFLRLGNGYRSLWLRGLVICLFFVSSLTWNEVGRTFGLDWIARLLLQRGIPVSLTVILLVWAISLLPWIFYRVAKTLSHNAKASYIAGICFTLLLYTILAWHSMSLAPGLPPRLLTLSLLLSFFQRIDIILILFLQSKRNNLISTSEPFSIFMIRVTDLLFFPIFVWGVFSILFIMLALAIGFFAIMILGSIYVFFNPPSRSSNRKSDELRSIGKNDFRWAFEERGEAQAEKAREEFYRGRNDDDS
jgi:hypothetical protein